ncbi:hypothetical protein EV426DRAFT_577235 [Tirmania nivea]|nr:hypothetical protein EV426DRAFT_577235 [Tirmania nivea]
MSVPLVNRRGSAAGNSTTEVEYERLRSLARSAHAERNSCYERSRAAYSSGQRALAKELSVEGKKHDRVGNDYHRQAKDYIFRVNNADRAENEIDLHGLYVLEAKEVLGKRIRAEKARGGTGLHVIVGKGNHSDGGVQRIKPAVEELCRELELQFSTEQNAGRMYISLVPIDGEQQPGEIPAGNKPHPPYIQGEYDTYAEEPQQTKHGFSGGSGEAWNGLQGSSLGGSGSSGLQYYHQQQQYPYQQQQQQEQHPNLADEEEVVVGEGRPKKRKTFFETLAEYCVVM